MCAVSGAVLGSSQVDTGVLAVGPGPAHALSSTWATGHTSHCEPQGPVSLGAFIPFGDTSHM